MNREEESGRVGKHSSTKSISRRVKELVSGLDIATASHEQIADMAEQVAGVGKEAVGQLCRDMVRGAAHREKLAALVACLRGKPAAWALATLRQDMKTRPLDPMQEAWLQATVRRLEEAAAPPQTRQAPSEAEAPAAPPNGELADLLTDGTQLLMWREELAALGPLEQEVVLQRFLASGDPGVLPLLEAALTLGRPQVDAVVADGLGRFPTPAALPLLRELLQRPDPTVRRRAHRTLAALERQGVRVRDIFVAATEVDEPVVASLVARPNRVGAAAAVVARRQASGLIRYAAVELDTIEAGVAAAWGESNLSGLDFEEQIWDIADENEWKFDAVELAAAQTVVAAAEAHTRAGGRELPLEFLAWRRVVGRAREPVPLPIVFGPSCALCGKRITPEDVEATGLVAGAVALCAQCGAKERHCARCGAPIHLADDEAAVRPTEGRDKLEFLCPGCWERGQEEEDE